MTPSLVISVSWKTLNCCHIIIGSPAYMHLSSPISLPAIPPSKPFYHLQYGELVPLPAPSGPWKSISCDFITDLPLSNGYNSLLVFIDHFTKMYHLVPCLKTTDTTEFVRLFLDNVICLYSIPESIVFDRDRSLCLIFGNLSHPWWIWNIDYLSLSTPRLIGKLNVWIKPSNNIFTSIAIINRIIGQISCLSQNSSTIMRINLWLIVLLSMQISVFIPSSWSTYILLLYPSLPPKLSQKLSSLIIITDRKYQVQHKIPSQLLWCQAQMYWVLCRW